MPEKADSGGFVLEIPVDASAISADDIQQQALKIVVKTCEGELQSQPVKLKADGTGSARFSFSTDPGRLDVLIGPERAEDAELAMSQTMTAAVPQSAWAGERQLTLPQPLLVTYWWWWWWWRWCREFTIHGRVICPDGRPVPGAEVCAYDVDWWWFWWSTEQVGCAVTDLSGSFDIKFRWCCGFWPWWWWRYRTWEYSFDLAERIVPVLERDPRIELGNAGNVPSLDVFKPLLAGTNVDTSKPLPSLLSGQLDQIRTSLLEKLPKAPELEQLRIWPWWPWWPWWDCTPDIIFKVTQDCLTPGAIIVDEGVGDTRWDIADPLNVTLIANELACCKPIPPCHEGDCIEIASFCSDEGIALDQVGGNPGAAIGQPVGYGPGDRPFSETIAVLKANTFIGVDYYEIEVQDPVTLAWGPVPAGACESFCRHWLQPIFPFAKADVPFNWKPMVDEFAVTHQFVVESREHYEAANPLPLAAYWAISDQLIAPLNTKVFDDNKPYTFHVKGYQANGPDKIKNGHVLLVCETDVENKWTLTFDNRIYPDASVPNCGGTFIHVCTKEPTTGIDSVTIDGAAIPACGTTEIKGDLVIDFEAFDPDGHLSHWYLSLHWGAGNVVDMLTISGHTLTWLSGDGQGPDYLSALGQGHGAAAPSWHGGKMRFTVPAGNAFKEPCCYLIRLEAWKRHYLGEPFGGGCGYVCYADQYYNIDEFTVGAGVCDPRPELPAVTLKEVG
jgi:hypothetical protein